MPRSRKRPWLAFGFRAARAIAGDRPPRYGCQGRLPFTVGRGPVPRHAIAHASAHNLCRAGSYRSVGTEETFFTGVLAGDRPPRYGEGEAFFYRSAGACLPRALDYAGTHAGEGNPLAYAWENLSLAMRLAGRPHHLYRVGAPEPDLFGIRRSRTTRLECAPPARDDLGETESAKIKGEPP